MFIIYLLLWITFDYYSHRSIKTTCFMYFAFLSLPFLLTQLLSNYSVMWLPIPCERAFDIQLNSTKSICDLWFLPPYM
jgi:hypothetical protein